MSVSPDYFISAPLPKWYEGAADEDFARAMVGVLSVLGGYTGDTERCAWRQLDLDIPADLADTPFTVHDESGRRKADADLLADMKARGNAAHDALVEGLGSDLALSMGCIGTFLNTTPDSDVTFQATLRTGWHGAPGNHLAVGLGLFDPSTTAGFDANGIKDLMDLLYEAVSFESAALVNYDQLVASGWQEPQYKIGWATVLPTVIVRGIVDQNTLSVETDSTIVQSQTTGSPTSATLLTLKYTEPFDAGNLDGIKDLRYLLGYRSNAG